MARIFSQRKSELGFRIGHVEALGITGGIREKKIPVKAISMNWSPSRIKKLKRRARCKPICTHLQEMMTHGIWKFWLFSSFLNWKQFAMESFFLADSVRSKEFVGFQMQGKFQLNVYNISVKSTVKDKVGKSTTWRSAGILNNNQKAVKNSLTTKKRVNQLNFSHFVYCTSHGQWDFRRFFKLLSVWAPQIRANQWN